MGFVANRIEKQSHKILFKEANKLGFSPAELDEVDLADKQAGIFHTLTVSMFGGGSAPTKLKRYTLSVDGRPAVFVRPFAGGIMHPGEIFTVLSGAPSESTARTFEDGWVGDQALAKDPGVEAAMKKFAWNLRTHLTFTLPWAIQVRAIGGGKSLLAMKSGSYGMMTMSYGLAKFREIAAAVEAALAGKTADAQTFVVPCYGDAVLETLQR